MAVEILMPELGESVHEGTVSRWLKQEGDFVKEDEPIVEIMTDKVNTELPSPASGILSKILIPEGGTVEVFHAMGLIEEKAGSAKSAAPSASPIEESVRVEPQESPEPVPPVTPAGLGDRRWYTPVVLSIAKARGITESELGTIDGTGESGRVTKKDVEAYLVSGRKSAAQPTAEPNIETKPAPERAPELDRRLVPLAGMRKMIADAMVRSSQVPTVCTVTQADVTAMVKFREREKDAFLEQYGVKLTYTPFFLKALAEMLTEMPNVNAALQPDNQVLINNAVHIGISVSLGKTGEDGLIVPVIRDCHKKTMIEIARDLDAIAKKARNNTLSVSDVQGGTFTLTNPGTYGALFGTPMILAPQAGILGAYGIHKMPVVIDDMIAIRSIMHLALTYDHRIVDGLVAGKFLAGVRDRLQDFEFFK